jgi:hypothetical protein
MQQSGSVSHTSPFRMGKGKVDTFCRKSSAQLLSVKFQEAQSHETWGELDSLTTRHLGAYLLPLDSSSDWINPSE